mmetsp:Transcript_28309/g.86547  ORF Transcript_28309/g.86547 Transcript_28309/m.86547 type:complete len:215 (-) Transcript_28309:39-683(-)
MEAAMSAVHVATRCQAPARPAPLPLRWLLSRNSRLAALRSRGARRTPKKATPCSRPRMQAKLTSTCPAVISRWNLTRAKDPLNASRMLTMRLKDWHMRRPWRRPHLSTLLVQKKLRPHDPKDRTFTTCVCLKHLLLPHHTSVVSALASSMDAACLARQSMMQLTSLHCDVQPLHTTRASSGCGSAFVDMRAPTVSEEDWEAARWEGSRAVLGVA